MKITSGRNPLAVGVDYREEYPKVCYQSIQMKEAQPLPLDFTGQTGRCACFRKVLSALKRFAVKEEMQVSLVLPDMEKETIEQYMQEACEAGCAQPAWRSPPGKRLQRESPAPGICRPSSWR